jgi:cysteine desulfurase
MSLVQAAIPGACINGDHDDQLPHLVNISIEGIDSEYIMYALDHAGISVSTKSICLLEEGDPVSPVVQMLGGESWRATTTLRFSFGRATTRRDVHRAVATLASVVSAYRAHGE